MREIRAQITEATEGKVRGYAAVFNTWSLPITERGRTFRERFAPGALKPEGNVSLWWMHDHKDPLANTRSGTLAISEDEKGIAFEADLGDGQRAAEIRDLVKRGVVSQMSIGFVVEADTWEGASSRTVTRARLHEVSLVENAAYGAATFAEVRGKKEPAMGLKENRARVAELRAEYEGASEDRQLEILTQIEETEAAIRAAKDSFETSVKATVKNNNPQSGSVRISAPPRDEVREWFRGGWREQRTIGLAITGGTANMGANAVVPQLSGEFVKALDQESVMRQLCTVETRGVDTDVSVINARMTASLISEGAAYSDQDFTTTKVQFTSYKSGVRTDVTEEALEDTVWDVATNVVQEHARAHSRLWEGYFATGTGSSQPRGVFHSGTGYNGDVTYTAGAAPTIDKVIDLFYKLNPAYLPGASWLMNQALWGVIVKSGVASNKLIMNGENGNILKDGAVALFMGKPVYVSEFAPTAYTATTRSVLFGDFKRGYRIIDRTTINFTVDDVSQRSSGIIRYSSRMRCDAKPVDTSAIVALRSA
jgi:HK97 family phage major capsid protein/HK97 family phage prohead protease